MTAFRRLRSMSKNPAADRNSNQAPLPGLSSNRLRRCCSCRSPAERSMGRFRNGRSMLSYTMPPLGPRVRACIDVTVRRRRSLDHAVTRFEMKLCGCKCKLEHSERAGLALQANAMFGFDHRQIKADSRIDSFLIKSTDDKRSIPARPLVCNLQIITEKS